MVDSNDIPRGYREELIRAINTFRVYGLNVIPLKFRGKEPLDGFKWKKYQEYQFNPTQLRNIVERKIVNLGIVLGKTSGNLFVLDFDDEEVFSKFIDEIMPRLYEDDILPSDHPRDFTWLVETSRGFHVYFRSEETIEGNKKLCPGIDLKAHGGYIVAPPSIHPSGKRYSPVSGFWLEDKEILVLDNNKINKLIEYISSLCPRPVNGNRGITRGKTRQLDENVVDQIVDLLVEFWKPGYRNNLMFGLVGYLYKSNVDPTQIVEIVRRIAERSDDEELGKRIENVEYQLKSRFPYMSPEDIAGISVIEEVLRSEVASGDVDLGEEIVSTTISILRSLVEDNGAVISSVIEYEDGEPLTRIIVYPERIIVKKKNRTKVIGEPGIRDAKFIKFIGVDLEDESIYIKLGDGREFSGELYTTIRNVIHQIPVHQRYRTYVHSLIRKLALRREPFIGFYSPGYWLVDGELIIVRRADYLPTWKNKIEWSPIQYVDGEDLSEAVKILKRFILSYRDPRKPLLVLAYAIVSNFAYELRGKLGYYPNLLIYGSKKTGKSLLMDMIRLLFNYGFREPPPGTRYELQRFVTSSKLPGLIEEFTLKEGNKKEMVDELHKMATITRIREISSKSVEQYGIYENIRALIISSNDPVLLRPDTIDKLIPLSLDKNEGVIEELVYGYTPNTIKDDKARLLLKKLGDYFVSKKLVSKIGEFSLGSREEIIQKIFEIGVSIIFETFEEFGEKLEIPGVDEAIREIVGLTNESFYDNYLEMFVHEILNSSHIIGLKVVEYTTKPDDIVEKVKRGYVVIVNDGNKTTIYISEPDRQKIAKHIEKVSEYQYYGRLRFSKMDGVKRITYGSFNYWRIEIE